MIFSKNEVAGIKSGITFHAELFQKSACLKIEINTRSRKDCFYMIILQDQKVK